MAAQGLSTRTGEGLSILGVFDIFERFFPILSDISLIILCLALIY